MYCTGKVLNLDTIPYGWYTNCLQMDYKQLIMILLLEVHITFTILHVERIEQTDECILIVDDAEC